MDRPVLARFLLMAGAAASTRQNAACSRARSFNDPPVEFQRMKQHLVSLQSRPSSLAPATTRAWQDELLEAVQEAYAPRIGDLPDEEVARALHAAYEATVLRGLRDRNAGQIRSFRRRFEEALSVLSKGRLGAVTGVLPTTARCGAAPASCGTERPMARRRQGRRSHR